MVVETEGWQIIDHLQLFGPCERLCARLLHNDSYTRRFKREEATRYCGGGRRAPAQGGSQTTWLLLEVLRRSQVANDDAGLDGSVNPNFRDSDHLHIPALEDHPEVAKLIL
ncbi:hypothetical protein SEVIR_8G185750v4 [Setaria viridis]|uniref:Uncharacterized protein n=1 Tax=Setaria viridis TaxID=4556 RepID=A0A4U6TLV5_SETVI|nr:hypothetical protein SEVIR_8G185750v2 [Setaria viridis]